MRAPNLAGAIVRMCCAALCLTSAAANAGPVIYNEAVSGDLPQAPTTVFSLGIGINSFSGGMSAFGIPIPSLPDDYDSIAFTIPTGSVLTQAIFSPSAAVSVIGGTLGLSSGSVPTSNPIATASFDSFQSISLFGGSTPLGPGTYTIDTQSLGIIRPPNQNRLGSLSYTLSLDVEQAAPLAPIPMLISNPIPDVCESGVTYRCGYKIFGPDIGSLAPEVRIDVGIQLVGNVSQAVKDEWEAGIQDMWSRKYDLLLAGDKYPVIVDVEFVDSNPDYIVNVFDTAGQFVGSPCKNLETDGRSLVLSWNVTPVACDTIDIPGFGPVQLGIKDDPAMRGRLAAHEFGHLLGLYDEYVGGGVDPLVDRNLLCDLQNDPEVGAYCGDFMANHWSGVLQERYFARILGPAFGPVFGGLNPLASYPPEQPNPGNPYFEAPWNQTPEPPTVVLIVAALALMASRQRSVTNRLSGIRSDGTR